MSSSSSPHHYLFEQATKKLLNTTVHVRPLHKFLSRLFYEKNVFIKYFKFALAVYHFFWSGSTSCTSWHLHTFLIAKEKEIVDLLLMICCFPDLSFHLVHPPLQPGAELRLNCSGFCLEKRKTSCHILLLVNASWTAGCRTESEKMERNEKD